MKRILFTTILILMLACSLFAQGKKESSNTLRVGMECAYAPYNWAQSDASNGAVPISGSNDYAYGYDVMMAKFIAEELGMELEIVKLDWDSIPVAVQAGTIDCAICGMSITAERQQTIDFSTPYYYASIVALTRSDSPYAQATGLSALSGAVCTSQLNTVWYDVCLPQISNAKILTAQESAPAMLVALNSGVCDLVVTDQPTALAACMAYPNMVMLDFTNSADNFTVSEEEINIGIAVRKNNGTLLDGINAALAKLTVDDFTSMMNQAIEVQPLSN
ncbi:MAG: transporter substrate-binding domain-containing protein [Spirochaetales bacterium]|nr:transporter substrate-binding domain-containing protein [Spirochaetales bacterium]